MTRWSNGMILAPGAGGPGFKSQMSPVTDGLIRDYVVSDRSVF